MLKAKQRITRLSVRESKTLKKLKSFIEADREDAGEC
jgi:hypothetical protein